MTDGRGAFLTVVVAGATLATAALLAGFWQAIFWAVVLAVLLDPLAHRVTCALNGRRALACGIVVLLAVVFVVVPVLVVGGLIIEEARGLQQQVASGAIDPGAALQTARELLPRVEKWAGAVGIEIEELVDNLRSVALHAGQFAGTLIVGIGENAARLALNTFLMLYLLFFLLKDGEAIYARVLESVPLPPEQKRRFFGRFATVAVATLKGAVVIGLVQGALGTLIFALLGVPGAVIWGALMAILSAVPALGPPIVWAPAALVLILQGDITSGIILIVFGALVIGSIDNLLRPPLVGRGTQMPDYLVLFSTLGGIALFGISGIVAGPVVMAFFLTAWQIYGEPASSG